MTSNDEKSVLDCAAQIQLLYDRLESSFLPSDDTDPASSGNRYLRIVGEINALQSCFDAFARLVKQLPECSDNVQRCKAQVSVLYGRFCSLQYEFSKTVDTGISEPGDLTSEEKEDSPEEPDAPEDVDPDAEEAAPEEEDEGSDDAEGEKEKKRKKKKEAQKQERRLQEAQHAAYLEHIRQQEAAERQRQEARRAAASAISGQSNPDRPWSEADIRMEEARRADEQRQKERREAENRRMEQDSRDAYQQRQEQAKHFEQPTAHIDMSFGSKRAGREPESPAHQPEAPEASSQPRPEQKSSRKENISPDLAQKIAAALGVPVETLHRMSSSELRFWQNRFRYASQPGHAPENDNQPPDSARTQRREQHTHGSASASAQYTARPEKTQGREAPRSGTRRYQLKRIADTIAIDGVKVGQVAFNFGKSAARSAIINASHKIMSADDSLAGISMSAHYIGTAAFAARAVIQHNPAAPLQHAAGRTVGQTYKASLDSKFARQRFNTFSHEKKLDMEMVSMLRNEKGKMPTGSKELQLKSQQIQRDYQARLTKKVGSSRMQRGYKSLNDEVTALKKQGAAVKAAVKQLKAKGILSAADQQELVKLQAELKRIGKDVAGLTNTLRAKQDLTYVSRRMQTVTRNAVRNRQALHSGAMLVRGFLLRPLAAGSESNTEGLYYANRILSDPLTHTAYHTARGATRWTLRQPLKLAHRIAPKAYEAAAEKVTGAAHAVAAAPKNLANRAVQGMAQGISNRMPKGLKTGLRRVRSTYATAKTGIQNAVFRATSWLADTRLGHAATTLQSFGRWASSSLRAIGTAVKGAASKALLVALAALLILGAVSSFLPSIAASGASSVIMSPEASTSGKINIGPYCQIYSSEARRFDQQVVGLLKKYSDKETYDDVQINYSGVSSNAREILSMMAVHLQQSLDITNNPDVKSYISYMFRQSHSYSVYESKYYCEGCKERPTGNTSPAPGVIVSPGGSTEKEKYCPGHIDVQINVTVTAFDGIFDQDHYPTATAWDGWTEANRDWCKMIYNMDWLELYEGLEYLSAGGITGVSASKYEQKIWDYLMGLIGNEYGAAGAMGNLYCESGLDPTNLQDTYEPILGFNNDSYTTAVDSGTYSVADFVNDSAGYGLAQWTWHTRKQALYNYCKSRGLSIGDIDGQLDYFGTELRGSFSGCLSALQNASSVEEASRIFMLRFEAPLDQSAAAIAVRQKYAEYFYNKFVYGTMAEGNLTEKQREVIHIAMNSASYGIAARPGYCQAWAAYVYAAAGLPIDGSASAYDSGMRYGVSSDFSAVPPGAAVYGYSGSKYGHVGIYVGNGLVYHNVGGVAIDTLSDWITKYRGFAWGWEAGSDLTTYD